MTAPPMSATTTAAVAARCSAAQVQRALVRDPAGGGRDELYRNRSSGKTDSQ